MEQLHQPGEIIAQRYCILDTLGQGGSGTTYAAEDLQNNQRIALKALSLRHMTDWKMIERFEREARVLSGLNHPAIPRYLEYFYIDTPEDRAFYIAQQLAEGQSLERLVQDGWHTNETEVREIATQLLEVLVYLHQLKPPVIHRDIKPQNVIRQADGKVFLVDFGAVQDTYHSTFAGSSTVVGTFGYMAPEQFRGQAVPTTDLYNLGATLLFLLTHRSPADLPTDGLKLDFRSRVQISEEFAEWLEKLLEPDVEDRFSSAEEALAQLRSKRIIHRKSQLVPWKGLVGIGVTAVAAVTAVTVLNSYKWYLLDSFGFSLTTSICNNADAIRNYLNQGDNINGWVYEQGSNPLTSLKNIIGRRESTILLICTAKSDDKELVKLLIAKGADVNAQDREGRTPLHWAADYGNKDVVKQLIAKDANVNARSNDGQTPLHRAAVYGRKDVVKQLIAKDANVNARSNDDQTPLHWAAQNGHKDVVEQLIAKGADVNAQDSEGQTPLHWAAKNNHKDVVEQLIAKGADIHAQDSGGETLLHWAAKNNHKDVVQQLIAKGADIHAQDNWGQTPLHWVTIHGNKDVVQQLIAKGADVNAKNNWDETPLHWAVMYGMYGNKDVVELLKRHGAK